jgi:transposase
LKAHCGTKNLPGRKSDVQECEWLRKLHTYGLLRASFRLDETIEAVRTVWRQRERVVKSAGESIQQMQKALTKMNVQLHNTISDISGVTGMAILRAIVGGERDPMKLAQLRHGRIEASEEEIARSLEGHWRQDTLWELKEVSAQELKAHLDAYDFQQTQLTACDKKLKECMAELPSRPAPEAKAETPALSAKDARKRRRKQLHKSKNEPAFALREELVRVTGVDLTAIDGISAMTAQTFFSEVGADLSAFPTEGPFCSWLQLTPKRDVSGGKVIRHAKSPVQSRVAVALRMGAESLWHSDSYLGAR